MTLFTKVFVPQLPKNKDCRTKKEEEVDNMSRRVSTQTEMKDKDLAIAALNQAGIMHEVIGNTIRMTSGFAANATLDLGTGIITGDDTFGHTPSNLGVLRQYYAEAVTKAEYLKSGTIIDERQNEGRNVILLWHTA